MSQVHVAPPGGWPQEPINPDKWADNMLKAWKVATYHKEVKVEKRNISLDDVDEAEADELVNTPRSLQACLYLGIDPSEIQNRGRDYFVERGLSKELQEIKFQYFEKERREKLARLKEERKRIISDNKTGSIFGQEGKSYGFSEGGGPDGKKAAALSTGQAKADAKAEVQRRREEKDKARKAHFEALKAQMQADAQRRVEVQQKKIAAQKAEKMRKDKEFAEMMRNQELQKLKEEEELEKKAQKLAEERYKHEMQLAAEAAKKAKIAKKQAIAKERERAKKQEEFRKQLEKIQDDIMKAAMEKTKEMQARDLAHKKLQEEKRKELAEMNAITRAEAEKRQAAALATWLGFLQKRKDDYAAKCAAERIRRKEKMIKWKIKQAEKKAYEEKQEQARLRTLQNAIDRREAHCQAILKKSREKDRALRVYSRKQELERRRHNIEKNLESSIQYWRCQATARKQALHRKQILDQIEKETAKVRALLQGRTQVQKDRQWRQAKELWSHAL